MQYSPNAEAKAIAQKIIDERRHDLKDVRIAYLFSDTIQKSNGKIVLGKTSKASAKVAYFGHVDYDITFPAELWAKMTEAQKLALVDHELMHVLVTYDEDENVIMKKRAHDFEGFREEIERHGFWHGDLAILEETVAAQLDLPMDSGKTKRRRADGKDQHFDA